MKLFFWNVIFTSLSLCKRCRWYEPQKVGWSFNFNKTISSRDDRTWNKLLFFHFYTYFLTWYVNFFLIKFNFQCKIQTYVSKTKKGKSVFRFGLLKFQLNLERAGEWHCVFNQLILIFLVLQFKGIKNKDDTMV